MVRELSRSVLKEISSVFGCSDFENCDSLIESLLSAEKIVVLGAGRMGYAAKGFSMRLKQLGLNSYTLGDSNLPRIKENDLLIIGSGSGETKSILLLAEITKKNKGKIALITGNPDSSIGKLADITIKLDVPSKNKPHALNTVQPMTTLAEQCLGIFFDCIVIKIMQKTGETSESMWKRHSCLE